jgi:hypothetical protein
MFGDSFPKETRETHYIDFCGKSIVMQNCGGLNYSFQILPHVWRYASQLYCSGRGRGADLR